MRIRLAVTADFANVTQEGKLNVIGMFERIMADRIPVTHPQMYLILRLEAEYVEHDREHNVEVHLSDQDGRKLFNISATLGFEAAVPGEKLFSNHILMLGNLQFHRWGAYTFDFFINNQHQPEASMVINVQKRFDPEQSELPLPGA